MGCWLFAHTQVRLRSLSLPANELTERGVLPIASALAVDDSLTFAATANPSGQAHPN